jgi:hypothetical protein
MPDFALRMSKILPLSEAISINVLPLVKSEQRDAWENYTLYKDYWVNEGVGVQVEWEGYRGPTIDNGTKNGVVHGYFGDVPANAR